MATINSISIERNWHPGKVIAGESDGGYSCIVLNRKIHVPPSVVENLWQNAQIRCTVDGGTNRWKNFITTHCQGKSMKSPDFITGDFDSITQDTSKYFCHPEIKRIHTPDQNSTDFTKAIAVLRPLLEEREINDIVVFHDTSGRLDQIMANINTLYKVQSNSLVVYLLSGNSISWLLGPGTHSIHIPSNLVENQRWCSLIPIGSKATVTTSGLKWNLNNSILEFGGIVSSSNTFKSELVQVETNSSILWAMGLFSFDDD